MRGHENEHDYKRILVKNETVINSKVSGTDLNTILSCTDAFKNSFCNNIILREDEKNILDNRVKLDVIKYYYVTSYELDITNRAATINVSYPKRNLSDLL